MRYTLVLAAFNACPALSARKEFTFCQSDREARSVLYDSTKGLLQSILRSLEAGDEARWDDRTESGNACLYEMHQMSAPFYKAYRSDTTGANSPMQSSFPDKLNRAMPYVRTMVIAI